MEYIGETPLLDSSIEKIEQALDLRRAPLAIQLTMEELRHHPHESYLYLLLARAYHQQGSQLLAVEAIRQSLTLDPENADAYAYHGLLISTEYSLEEAEESFRYALSLEPDSFFAHYSYAAFLFEVKEATEEALFHVEKALEQSPESAVCYTLLGLTLAKLGRVEEAEKSIQTAVSLAPEAYDTHSACGLFYLQSKRDVEKAYPSLLEAVRLNPEDETLRQHLLSVLGAKNRFIGAFWKVGFWLKRWGKKTELIYPLSVLFIIICGFTFQSNPTIGLILTIPVLALYVLSFVFVAVIDPLFRRMVERL